MEIINNEKFEISLNELSKIKTINLNDELVFKKYSDLKLTAYNQFNKYNLQNFFMYCKSRYTNKEYFRKKIDDLTYLHGGTPGKFKKNTTLNIENNFNPTINESDEIKDLVNSYFQVKEQLKDIQIQLAEKFNLKV